MAPVTMERWNDETMEREIFSMRTMQWLGRSLPVLFLLLFCGCGGTGNGSTPAPVTPAPLSAANINLIFVVSEDLNYQASGDGDLNQSTGNLTSQGLQRSLLMAPFLQKNVLGGNKVTDLRARTDDPFANREPVPRYGGTGDDSAVCPAQ